MLLQELFNQPHPYKWDTPVNRTGLSQASFSIGDQNYEIAFDYSSYHKSVMLEFYQVQDGGFGDTGITGTGNALEVFGTVMACIRDYVSKARPASIRFSASEPSRIRLYNRLANNVAKELGWELTTNKSPMYGMQYTLSAPNAAQ